MARPLRIQYPGAVYHLTSMGNARKAIFKDDQDRLAFLDILALTNERYQWICHAYCLMDNHYHLVIETPRGNLSLGMRQLNGVYTQAYNMRHRRVGHIFQGRYKAILVEKESYLLELARYVVLNPVRARMVEQPSKWKWSSYGGTAGMAKAHECLTPDWLLEQFGRKQKEARNRYRRFVREGVGGESIWDEVKGQVLLGSEKFVKGLEGYMEGAGLTREIPRVQRYATRPELSKLFSGSNKESRKKRTGLIQKAVRDYGYTQRELADYLGLHYSTVSRLVNREG